MAKRKKPKPQEISVEVNGKIYTALYTVESGVVTVFTPDGHGPISELTGGGPAEPRAKLLLEEMAESGKLDH
jgi:hypothetical protein